MYEMVAFEGTRVYVYAKEVDGNYAINRYSANQRVYEYGIAASEIDSKLYKTVESLKQSICSCIEVKYEATQVYGTTRKSKQEIENGDLENYIVD